MKQKILLKFGNIKTRVILDFVGFWICSSVNRRTVKAVPSNEPHSENIYI